MAVSSHSATLSALPRALQTSRGGFPTEAALSDNAHGRYDRDPTFYGFASSLSAQEPPLLPELQDGSSSHAGLTSTRFLNC